MGQPFACHEHIKPRAKGSNWDWALHGFKRRAESPMQHFPLKFDESEEILFRIHVINLLHCGSEPAVWLKAVCIHWLKQFLLFTYHKGFFLRCFEKESKFYPFVKWSRSDCMFCHCAMWELNKLSCSCIGIISRWTLKKKVFPQNWQVCDQVGGIMS